MNKVNIIGEQAWHVFRDAKGNEIKIECSVSEYDSLALPNPTNPTSKDLTWTYSYKDWKYDTVSGRLEDGCYVEFGGQATYKLAGQDQTSVPISEITSIP